MISFPSLQSSSTLGLKVVLKIKFLRNFSWDEYPQVTCLERKCYNDTEKTPAECLRATSTLPVFHFPLSDLAMRVPSRKVVIQSHGRAALRRFWQYKHNTSIIQAQPRFHSWQLWPIVLYPSENQRNETKRTENHLCLVLFYLALVTPKS